MLAPMHKAPSACDEPMPQLQVNCRAAWVRRRAAGLIVAAIILMASCIAPARAADHSQASFARPDEAVRALIAAAEAGSMADLLKVLGPEAKPLVSSGDPVADREALARFTDLYAEANRIAPTGAGHATLLMGKDEWPFPIPLVSVGGAWHFDTAAGKDEILNRRIGHNELSAIEVCRSYVDAQREYASKDRNNNGFLEYAQKFASSPGKHDGLYWPAADNEEESPLGPLVASAQAAGYGAKSANGARVPYFGYYYRILKGQGDNAPGGAYDYVANGQMIGGFALVAFPAQYDVSGVMTFIVNQDGVVYQKDLGPNTAAIAEKLARFDPDPSWTKP
jgi:hypothetical protein